MFSLNESNRFVVCREATDMCKGPNMLFADFRGAVQVDGYAGYDFLDMRTDVDLLGRRSIPYSRCLTNGWRWPRPR